VYGSSYTVRSKAKSLYGDRWQGDPGQLPITESVFWFDNQPPVSVVNVPPVGVPHYNALTLPTISGTATDELAGVYKVEYSIQDLTRGTTFWNAATQSWVSAVELWNTANWTSPVWSTYIPAGYFTDGHTYRVKSKSYDATLPAPGIIEVPSLGNDFVYDISLPTATVTRPPADGVNSIPFGIVAYKSSFVITGDMFDVSPGVPQRVEILVYDMVDSKYYTGTGWQTGEVWISTETTSLFKLWTSSWSYEVGSIWTSGKKYLIVSRCRDKAGNWQENFVVGVSSNQFIYDTQPPQTAVTVPAQQYVNVLTNISGTASDALQTYYVGLDPSQNRVKIVIYNATDNTY